MIRHNAAFVCICFFVLSINGTDIIQGDSGAPTGKTFSFPISTMVISGTGTLYTGSAVSLTDNQNFALARLTRGAKAFTPIAPGKIVVNSKADEPNPLYGAQITTLSTLKPVRSPSELLLTTTAATPATFYLVEKNSMPEQMSIVKTETVKDASGADAGGIVNQITNNVTHAFAAVTPVNGQFGDAGTGIALLAFGDLNNTAVFGQVDATNGSIVSPRAAALDRSSPILTMNSSPLSAISNVVSLHWDMSLQRLFIGLSVTSGSGINDAALAIIVGTVTENGGLELTPIVPESVFNPGDQTTIIGVKNTSNALQQSVTISALDSMYTSTKLSYLIVVGNVQNGTNIPEQSVFALPLVNNVKGVATIAQKNATPENVFNTTDKGISKFIGRIVSTPATTPSDMTQSTDIAAQVGGGTLPAGTITSMFVRDDTVFVSVGNNKTFTESSGIYSSQAIFNAAGTITHWTQWQRAVGTIDNVFNSALNTFDGTTLFAVGTDQNSVDTVVETTWSGGNSQGLLPVTNYLNSLFNVSNGGIQSFTSLLPSTPGLAEVSLMAVGGIGKLVLVQTGLVDSNVIIPTPATEFTSVQEFENGAIDTMVNAKIISFAGGALDSVGPITATTIGSDGTNGWLFVGGSHGLAILSNPDGSGWSIAQNELGNGFDGLQIGMSFKMIGDYRFIKKLISDDNFLYVIANDRIDRINLQTTDFSTNIMSATTIATLNNIPFGTQTGAFLDATISQAFGLAATTGGLLAIAQGKDIRLLTDNAENNWTRINTPESAGAPIRLVTTTNTGLPEDITRFNGGQIYVLTANEGYNQSRINRFAVSPLQQVQTVQDKTIEPFDDLFVKNIPSFFLNFNEYTSIFNTNGGLYFAARSKNNNIPPHVILTPGYVEPQVGVANVGERSGTVIIPTVANATEINGFAYSQASGSLVIAGDFGMQVLE
jgi:hypothetical protein